jgi:uncharacterized protein
MDQINLAFAFAGLVVGALVGLTGVGGGSLMTPILILLFGVHPLSAVGTDLVFAATTKATGTRVHAYRGNVDWRVVGLLLLGSVPGSLLTIFLLTRLPLRRPEVTHVITVAIGVALLLTAAGLLFGDIAGRFTAKIAGRRASTPPGARPGLTVFLGIVLGVLVSLTSVGAGAVGMAVLRRLYPRMPTVRLVGSDIAHAVPLTLLAGSGHWLLGDVNWALLGSLLLGSIPGIIVASRLAHRVPDEVLRRLLGLILLGVSAPLLVS